MAQACLKPPVTIRETYFVPAHEILATQHEESAGLAHIPYQFAVFAEHQYQAIARSDTSAQLQRHMERKQLEVQEYASALSSSSRSTDSKHRTALSQAQRTAKLMLDQDARQFTLHVEKLNSFLRDAITMFTRSLVLSDEYDQDAVIRLCSLWFSNFNDVHLNQYISESIDAIPSRKFVFLAHQLTARLSALTRDPLSSGSQQALQNLMIRLCREHPFHSLYQVYALRQGFRAPPRRSSTPTTSNDSQNSRKQAAEDLFNSLRGDSVEGNRLQDIETLCDAYVEWAKHPIKGDSSQDKNQPKDKDKQPGKPIPAQLKLHKVRNMKVPVSTAHTPVDPSCQYNNIVGIKYYGKRYTTAGGYVMFHSVMLGLEMTGFSSVSISQKSATVLTRTTSGINNWQVASFMSCFRY